MSGRVRRRGHRNRTVRNLPGTIRRVLIRQVTDKRRRPRSNTRGNGRHHEHNLPGTMTRGPDRTTNNSCLQQTGRGPNSRNTNSGNNRNRQNESTITTCRVIFRTRNITTDLRRTRRHGTNRNGRNSNSHHYTGHRKRRASEGRSKQLRTTERRTSP